MLSFKAMNSMAFMNTAFSPSERVKRGSWERSSVDRREVVAVESIDRFEAGGHRIASMVAHA